MPGVKPELEIAKVRNELLEKKRDLSEEEEDDIDALPGNKKIHAES